MVKQRRPLSTVQSDLIEQWRCNLLALSRPNPHSLRKFFYHNLPEARKRNVETVLLRLVSDVVDGSDVVYDRLQVR